MFGYVLKIWSNISKHIFLDLTARKERKIYKDENRKVMNTTIENVQSWSFSLSFSKNLLFY
jgi:hypothetical protein